MCDDDVINGWVDGWMDVYRIIAISASASSAEGGVGGVGKLSLQGRQVNSSPTRGLGFTIRLPLARRKTK